MEATRNMHGPGLFGLGPGSSNRDFRTKDSWGKNKFNNAFPVSLVSYMDSIGLPLIYLSLNDQKQVTKTTISAEYLFGLKPLSPSLYFSFESVYPPFQTLILGNAPGIDLVTFSQSSHAAVPLRALEIKLTAIPDSTTYSLSESNYGCELVIRPDTIVYLALQLAIAYRDERESLKRLLDPHCAKITSWEDADNVRPHKAQFVELLDEILLTKIGKQTPFLLQPIWKTRGRSAVLEEQCFDVFVWSDFAFTRLFINSSSQERRQTTVTRQERSIYWLVKLLLDFAADGQFDHQATINRLIYDSKSDKAFAVAGTITNRYMASAELTRPRVSKAELRKIILGGGQDFLSPERRLDAAILSTPGLFDVSESGETDARN